MPFPPPTEKQARVIWLALTGLAVATLVALVAGIVWGLGHLLQVFSPVLWPLAIAGVLACLLDPVVDRFEKRGLSRATAILPTHPPFSSRVTSYLRLPITDLM